MKNIKNVFAIVECRMTSSRLPGKVLLESCGKTVLELLVERLKRARGIHGVLLATTTNETDDPIVELAKKITVPYFRGSEHDVLNRVYLAAKSVNADLVVEVTGDCPLIDPSIVADTLDLYLKSDADYVSNDLEPTYPIGMNVAIFSTKMLEIADKAGDRPEDREHVGWYFVRNPDQFKQMGLSAPKNLRAPEVRLTLDEKADFLLIDSIFKHFYKQNPSFTCEDILRHLDSNPTVKALNSHVQQKPLPDF